MKDYTAMFNRRSCTSFWQPVGGNLLLFQSLNNGNATHWTNSFPFKFCMASKHLSPSATHYKPFFLLLHPCITHSPESNMYHGKEYLLSICPFFWCSPHFMVLKSTEDETERWLLSSSPLLSQEPSVLVETRMQGTAFFQNWASRRRKQTEKYHRYRETETTWKCTELHRKGTALTGLWLSVSENPSYEI